VSMSAATQAQQSLIELCQPCPERIRPLVRARIYSPDGR
jgi:hypothetical protein